MLPIILGHSGPVVTCDERAFFRAANPAGYLLFGRNVGDPEQLRALTDDLRALSGRDDLPILIDQEGGRCARLGPPHWPATPAAARFAALYQRAPISAMEAARVHALAIALTLRAAGITVNCMPVLDLASADGHPVIGDRALGSDPLQVAALGRLLLDGLAQGGVAACIKHIPGHGRARADSHVELPVVDADAAALEDDLLPFRRLAAAPMAMAAHVLYSAWDAERPASLSPIIIQDVIRGSIGFDNLLISDDIVMNALSGTLPGRANGVLAAGCDLALLGSGELSDNDLVCSALPPITPLARQRLDRAMATQPNIAAKVIDLVAKRDTLLALA